MLWYGMLNACDVLAKFKGLITEWVAGNSSHRPPVSTAVVAAIGSGEPSTAGAFECGNGVWRYREDDDLAADGDATIEIDDILFQEAEMLPDSSSRIRAASLS